MEDQNQDQNPSRTDTREHQLSPSDVLMLVREFGQLAKPVAVAFAEPAGSTFTPPQSTVGPRFKNVGGRIVRDDD